MSKSQQIDLSFLPVPNIPYTQQMSQMALMRYLHYLGKMKPTEQLICQFEEAYLGTFTSVEDFTWKALQGNLIFPQVEAIGLAVRHIDVEQLAYEWFNDTEYGSATYTAIYPVPLFALTPKEQAFVHIFNKLEQA